MKKSEAIKKYFARVTAVVNQMRRNGETMSDTIIKRQGMSKLCQSMNYKARWLYMSRNPSLSKRKKDQALRMSVYVNGRGRGIGMNRGRGRRGRAFYKSHIECFKCKKLEHFQIEYPKWEKVNYDV
ncbi:uncharacterized protein LOC124913086 [Impatiens glandulifera]|uniref:uncharacterized protein LOC124913086 n=1 Tax=Impatiens glandulifera TaxID=253017 RepID=UPI001FB0F301|nr:uncharacterized protein LOC124913086 [Impatiens glandulifera]